MRRQSPTVGRVRATRLAALLLPWTLGSAACLSAPSEGTPPELVILDPSDGATVGRDFAMRVTVDDGDPGQWPVALTVESDVDGELAAFSVDWAGDHEFGVTRLTPGAHVLTVRGVDSDDSSSSDSVRVEVVPAAPEVQILAPADGAVVAAGAPVDLDGEVHGDGDGSMDVEWSSDLDGVLFHGAVGGTGQTTVAVSDLSVGEHVITLEAIEAGGGWSVSASAAVTLTVVDDTDGDGDGYGWDDCDDDDPDVHPGATEVCDGADEDCDGDVDDALDLDGDGDGITACDGDCDDADAAVGPGSAEVCDPVDAVDDDCDGVVDDGFDLDSDGVTTCAGDCDDGDPEVHPGAPEACDGEDDDCDGEVDELEDADADGVAGCEGDCDDGDPGVRPGLDESCDGLDNDCDAGVDEGFDVDGDGVTTCGGDCDDTDPAVGPDATETCDGQDDDCDGAVDEEEDADGDGMTACAGDCDDGDPDVRPGFAEACDGVDQDCDGAVDEGFDTDGDGFTVCAGDCDDGDDGVHPGAGEDCDGIDGDCAGLGADELDADGDGRRPCAGDCDDSDSLIRPGMPEGCDGIDQDCDGLVDEGWDADGDAWTTCAGDCDDGDTGRHPGATETCDAEDDDCDGEVDEGADVDGDGWTACAGDCDDADPSRHPGAEVHCDGIDNDCDGRIDLEFDEDHDGSTWCGGDCDDGDAGVRPGTYEECNGTDDDCDGLVDEGSDADGDGHTWCGGDCDDLSPDIHPGAPEACNGVDDDCDWDLDEGFDLDGDGYRACGGDCDDADPERHPGAIETCDGEDDDCDGQVDDADDLDGDGYSACDDCDDHDSVVHPQRAWDPFGDDRDEDCDGADGDLLADADTILDNGNAAYSTGWTMADLGPWPGERWIFVGNRSSLFGRPLGIVVSSEVFLDGFAAEGAHFVPDPVARIFHIDGVECSAAVPVGDVDADSRVELAIGCAGEDGGRGAVYVVLSSTLGAGGDIFLGSDAGAILYGPDPGCGLGASLVGAGDLDADGRDDLVVGGPGCDDPLLGDALPQVGRVFVVSGNVLIAGGTFPVDTVAMAEVRGAIGDEFVGQSVAVVGYGRSDVAIGSPGSGASDQGAVRIFPGATLLSGVWPVPLGDALTTFTGVASGDALGLSLSADLDFDTNGLPDLAAGAHYVNPLGVEVGRHYCVRDRDLGAGGTRPVETISTEVRGPDGATLGYDRRAAPVGGDIDGVSGQEVVFGTFGGAVSGPPMVWVLRGNDVVAGVPRGVDDAVYRFQGESGDSAFGIGVLVTPDLVGAGTDFLIAAAPGMQEPFVTNGRVYGLGGNFDW